jgi:dolichol-phosphate mannosyltransferase
MLQNKESNYVSVVAVINENSTQENLTKFINMVVEYCQETFDNFELIFVDNNSNIKVTGQIFEQLNNKPYNASLVTLPYQQNKEQAVMVGVEATVGDYIFEFEDIDVDYVKENLHAMYEKCLAGNDIVFLKPLGKSRLLANKFYKLLARYSNKNSAELFKSRVNLISRRGINRVASINKIIYYRKYAYCNAGLQYEYVDYFSTSKNVEGLSLAKIDHATDLLIIFTSLGKRISLLFSTLFALISIFSLVYTIIAYFTLNVVYGWTTVMLLLSTSFAGIFICFTIVIKYLSILLQTSHIDESMIASKRKI